MSLFTRLVDKSEGDAKIKINVFCGCLNEYILGQLNTSQIIELLKLDESETNDLNSILSNVTPQKITDISYFLMLGEVGIYDPKNYLNEEEFWERVNGS